LASSIAGGGNTNRSFASEGEPDGDTGFGRGRLSNDKDFTVMSVTCIASAGVTVIVRT
jgi:hypothetical protein